MISPGRQPWEFWERTIRGPEVGASSPNGRANLASERMLGPEHNAMTFTRPRGLGRRTESGHTKAGDERGGRQSGPTRLVEFFLNDSQFESGQTSRK